MKSGAYSIYGYGVFEEEDKKLFEEGALRDCSQENISLSEYEDEGDEFYEDRLVERIEKEQQARAMELWLINRDRKRGILIFCLRCGKFDGVEHSPKDIAMLLGVSPSYARGRIMEQLYSLRNRRTSDGFKLPYPTDKKFDNYQEFLASCIEDYKAEGKSTAVKNLTKIYNANYKKTKDEVKTK